MSITTPPRFEALPFDAEARLPAFVQSRLFSLWMLIPGVALIAQAGSWIFVDGVALWSLKVWATIGLDAIWLGLFGYFWRERKRDWSRYLEVLPTAINVHIPDWYEAIVPFDAISRIERRERYELRDAIAESLTWAGRIPERGAHVAIRCNRRIDARAPLRPFNWRKTFRAKLREPEAFIALANQRLDQWRREQNVVATDVQDHMHISDIDE